MKYNKLLLNFLTSLMISYPDKVTYSPIVSLGMTDMYNIFTYWSMDNNTSFTGEKEFINNILNLKLPIFYFDVYFRFIPSQVLKFISRQ